MRLFVTVRRLLSNALLVGGAVAILPSTTPAHASLPATAKVSAARPDFNGSVRDAGTGKPIRGATVSLAYAAPRVGTSSFCPSCWADCSKRATTTASGAFHIPSTDPALRFTVLVVRDGYKPTYFRDVEPGSGPSKFRLAPAPHDKADDPQILRGQVVDSDGHSIVGASLEVDGYAQNREAEAFGGVPENTDPLVVTGNDGRFVFHLGAPYRYVLLQAEAPGMARRLTGWLQVGKQPERLVMTEGAVITGRVRAADGRTFPGLTIGWTQVDLNCEVCVGPMAIGTDAHGQFVFPNVRPKEASRLCVYSDGALAKADLAVPIVSLTTAEDGKVTALGDLQAVPAATFLGRLRFSDGHSVPPNTRILYGRSQTWDAQQVIVAPDGTFAFHGIPPGERIDMTVRVPGYTLDRKTEGLDPNQPQFGSVNFTAPGAGPMPERTFFLLPDKTSR